VITSPKEPVSFNTQKSTAKQRSSAGGSTSFSQSSGPSPGGRVSGPLLRQPIVDGLLPPPFLWQPCKASPEPCKASPVLAPPSPQSRQAADAPVFTFSLPSPAACTTGDGTVGRASSQYAYPLSSRRRPTTAATADLRVDTQHPSHRRKFTRMATCFHGLVGGVWH
jgi:hypothetical protein